MQISVKYFGLAGEILKPVPLPLDVADATTIGQLLKQLTQGQDEANITLLQAATFLVNKEKATRGTVLQEGDEVLIMLRLAGG